MRESVEPRRLDSRIHILSYSHSTSLLIDGKSYHLGELLLFLPPPPKFPNSSRFGRTVKKITLNRPLT